jgi:mono/diheme cytochrome c family protein
MKRAFRHITVGTGALLLTLIVFVEVTWDRTFEAPLPEIEASTDPAVVEHGGYLVYHAANCSSCHTSPAQQAALRAGGRPPLSGGTALEIPFGTIRFPNLTPDVETGIGRLSDAELARALRHGVRRDGRPALAMEFQNLADDDLAAILSFLRAQAPVRNPVPDHELNFIGRAVSAFVIRPKGPAAPPPAAAPRGATVERGRYLAWHVAECYACHTNRDMVSGKALGAPFAGGRQLPDDDDPSRVFVTPNLTPDPATGRMASWSEEQFVARFRGGRVYPGSHMPWEAFAGMTDDDLRAIYRYLRTLTPVVSPTGPALQAMKD